MTTLQMVANIRSCTPLSLFWSILAVVAYMLQNTLNDIIIHQDLATVQLWSLNMFIKGFCMFVHKMQP